MWNTSHFACGICEIFLPQPYFLVCSFVALKRDVWDNVKNLENTKFLNLGKIASHLGTNASDWKMDAIFVISDPKNPWIGKKIFLGVARLSYRNAINPSNKNGWAHSFTFSLSFVWIRMNCIRWHFRIHFIFYCNCPVLAHQKMKVWH